MTRELSNQNMILAGLSSLLESLFVTQVLIAQQVGIPREQLPAIINGERQKIRAEFTGK
jgi:plasmid maintenance system antidote protein VapI